MLIDWFTVGAQVLNFLILVWLLEHFLYKPVLNAIDSREKRIAAELEDAAAQKAAAQRERDEFRGKNKAFDEQRGALLGKSADEAKVAREHLLADAHREADRLRVQQENALRDDQKRLGQQISRVVTQEVFGVARKALMDLAAADLEERMGEVFTRRLREMDEKARESLAAALKVSSEPAILRSSFEIPSPVRATIRNALNETFAAEIPVRFETAPDIISGIELTASGQKLAWSIAEYLATLAQKVESLLDAQITSPQAAPTPQAGAGAKASTMEAS